jgi:pimeloyl-ACP methyl ester carboxylesterase
LSVEIGGIRPQNSLQVAQKSAPKQSFLAYGKLRCIGRIEPRYIILIDQHGDAGARVSKDSKAVFLSYASQDAEAARRICDALRAAGVQVWLDQSELRGGEAWDNAIRQRIKSCALFIAVVSRNTHRRDEGYFRLEWKLAVDRSHLMSSTRPFLIPVVIDDAPNDDQVPDRFRDLQWTSLPAGETNAAFVNRIVSLLSPEARLVPIGGGHPELCSAEPPIQGAGNAIGASLLKQEVRFARVADGTRIAFATTGSGYPLINAAHWLGHLEFDLQTPVWREWVERLSARYRLTRYDSRGCGLSDRDVSSISLEDLVADLAAVADAAGLERFALLGKSQGGAISIAYAAKYPERVSHLILCGAFARSGFGRNPGEQERLTIEGLIQLVRVGWGKTNTAFRQLFTNLFFPHATSEQTFAFTEIQRKVTSPAHAARLLLALSKVDASSYLGHITCPTLVIHCRDDAVVPLSEGRFLASSIPGARFESLNSQNHIPLEGEPAFERVFDLLREFLPSA